MGQDSMAANDPRCLRDAGLFEKGSMKDTRGLSRTDSDDVSTDDALSIVFSRLPTPSRGADSLRLNQCPSPVDGCIAAKDRSAATLTGVQCTDIVPLRRHRPRRAQPITL